MKDEPTKDQLRQMVAAMAVEIGADERTMSCLMQAARIGWEYGSGRRKWRANVIRGS